MRSRLGVLFRQKILKPQIIAASLTSGLFAGYLYSKFHDKSLIHAATKSFVSVGERKPNLPTYSMNEVAKHTTKETGYWLAYKDGVYDISSYIEDHPGGKTVLRTAGKALEACWKIFTIHQMDHVYEILEEYRIGNLPPGERQINEKELEKIPNYFQYDPERENIEENFFIRSKTPFNVETKPSLLVSSFITPVEKFFIRNHMHVPFVNVNEYKLQITNGTTTHSLSFDDLTEKYSSHTITSVLQCSANRRHEFNEGQKTLVRGAPWNVGAIGNARWTGVKLRDVLESFGLDKEGKYVQFFGLDCETPKRCYGASIPMEKALSDDVLIAYEMNDEPLTRDHGYPLRIIAPGTIGARNVKWVNRIIVSDKESDSPWYIFDYKVFPSSVKQPQKSDFDTTPALQETNVNSAICCPASDDDGNKVKVLSMEPNKEDVKNRKLTIKGYAVGAGGRQVKDVQISLDNGKTWRRTELEQLAQPAMRAWAWTLWAYHLPFEQIPAKPFEILCRATDIHSNTQPDKPSAIWNVLGHMNNSWHKISLKVDEKFLKK